MRTKILGICNDETSSVCLLENGILKAAVSEERFSRKKLDNSFPTMSIDYVLDATNTKIKEIDCVSYAWFKGLQTDVLQKYLKRSYNSNYLTKTILNRVNWEVERDSKKRNEINSWIENHINPNKIHFEDFYHHEAHASSASFFSPFSDGIVMTCDARGDFESLSIWEFDRKKKIPLKKIYSCTSLDSLGFFYGRITGLLGFKPMRHEGKVTGLAALGDPKKALPLMKKMIKVTNGEIISFPGKYYKPFFKPYDKGLINEILSFDKKDIAAAAQAHLEHCLIKILNYHLKKIDKKSVNLMLAGGVFSNVKVNQALKELALVKNIFVQPQMGDGGLCLGAAALSANKRNINIDNPKNVYLGPSPNTIFNKNMSKKFKISKQKNLSKSILKDLLKNQVVGLIFGRMEFGPRALCNRSILYKTSDIKINDWLNKRLNRNEFMPFAPIIREEVANVVFKKFDKTDQSLRFMTSTINCKKIFLEKSPAVCHVDKTTRPQIIRKKENPMIWELLKNWEKNTGEFALVNTSFNTHEEPIVCNTEDGLKNLEKGTIDCLYVNEYKILRFKQ